MGMGAGAAGLPLEALLGMAPPPAAPPGAAAMGGGMPMGAPAAGPIPGMPSTDPMMVAQLRAADHAALDAAQDAAQAEASMMMQTATAAMGGGMPPVDPASLGAMPPGPAGGDIAALLGAAAPPMPLPGSATMAYGGPDAGSTESESITPLPGSAFAQELGGY